MFARLPISIDPYREAERNSQYTGELQLSQMNRLEDALLDRDGTVQCEFQLYREKGPKFWVKGSFTTTLTLECQRCMKPYRQVLSADFLLRVVTEEGEAEVAEEGFEPLIVEGDQLDILSMIEEEVLLAIPLFPKHEEMEDCHWRPPALEESVEPERENPFAVLEKLKKH